MEAPALAEMGDLCHPCSSSPEGETVCGALARYETTLREAIREISLDLSAFKVGVEQRLEETSTLTGPLGRVVVQLQQENRQLRSQVDTLSQQVALLSGITCDRTTLTHNNHSLTHKNHLSHAQENHMVYGKGQTHLHTQTCTQGGPVQTCIQGGPVLTCTQGGPVQTCTRGSPVQTCNRDSPVQTCTQGSPVQTCTRDSPVQTYSGTSGQTSPPFSSSPPSSMVIGPVSSSSPSPARFSSRATFAVSSKTNSIEREEPIEVDHPPSPPHVSLENGHARTTEQSMLVHDEVTRATDPTDRPHEHQAPVAMRMPHHPHLPITATTKTSDLKGSPDPLAPRCSPVSEVSPGLCGVHQPRPGPESPSPAGVSFVPLIDSSVKTWTPPSVRALGSPGLQEKISPSPVRSVTYCQQSERDRDQGSEKSYGLMGERRRELVRSQTLPRNLGAQTRRSALERVDSEANNSCPKPVESKATLKRSQSFGVSSVSSIKQILLDWCRSKTNGYQNMEIQNFSSSWSDGMAFCALVHAFFPSEFDYNSLSPGNRRDNFELAFQTAELKAGCDRLIEVDDMMVMGRKPDPRCVFTYVQSLYNHLRRFEV